MTNEISACMSFTQMFGYYANNKFNFCKQELQRYPKKKSIALKLLYTQVKKNSIKSYILPLDRDNHQVKPA